MARPLRPFPLLCRLLDSRLANVAPAADLEAAVADPLVPWSRLVTLSGVHLLTPGLAAALDDLALARLLPPDLVRYFRAMQEANAGRNQDLRWQLERVAATLNEAGIVPVALKGAIRLLDGLYPHIAWRFMHDLDLLVPGDRLAVAALCLHRAGWCEAPGEEAAGERHLTFVHGEAVARIELHAAPLDRPYRHRLPADRMVADAVPIRLGAGTLAVPTTRDQILHLVLHGMLQHAFLRSGRILLRDLVELALLLRGCKAAEQARLQEDFAEIGQALAWALARRLASLCLPETAPAGAEDGLAVRLLAARMLLQQRSPVLMRMLAPVGWLARTGSPHPVTGWLERWSELRRDWQLFRRKTSW